MERSLELTRLQKLERIAANVHDISQCNTTYTQFITELDTIGMLTDLLIMEEKQRIGREKLDKTAKTT